MGKKESSLARSASKVSCAVFFSRILGLVREQVLAGLFGAGTQMDAFVVAFRIPNLLRDLFAEGALSSAFVTVFTEFDEKRSKEDTLQLVTSVLTVLTVIVSIIVLLGILFAKGLVLLMAPEFQQIAGKVELTTVMTQIMFPFLLAISTASVFMGILNARSYFFLPAIASAMFNLSSILVGGGLAMYLPRHGIDGIIGMAIGTLIGGIAQMAIQLPPLVKIFRPSVKKSSISLLRPVVFHPGVKKILKLMIPAIIGLSATQLNIFINTNFASRCAEGSVAWLNYAFRLILFPIGVFGVAVSIAAMPRFAKGAARTDLKALGDILVSSLTLSMALTIPASVGLWVLGEPIVRLIFERGQFRPFDTLMTVQALKLYAIGLFAYSSVKIVVPAFYALNDTKWPVTGSFMAVVLNVIIILVTLSSMQHRAIALSTSITMIVNFAFLTVILYRKIGGFPLRNLFVEGLKILFASLLMGFAVSWLSFFIDPDNGTLVYALEILAVIVVGAFIYFISAYLLHIRSIRMLTARLF